MSVTEFWQSTPRTVWLARQAYFARRGWLAYHVALLGRMDGKRFPTLAQMTGEKARPMPAQAPEEMLHNLRLIAAAQDMALTDQGLGTGAP